MHSRFAQLACALFAFLVLFGAFVSSAATAAPSAPTGLTTSSTSNSITLYWQAPAGVTTYSLWQDGAWKGTNTSTSYTFTGLSCGTTYQLTVAAYDASWNMSPQSSVSASTSACGGGSGGAAAPGAPTALSSSSTQNAITSELAGTSGRDREHVLALAERCLEGHEPVDELHVQRARLRDDLQADRGGVRRELEHVAQSSVSAHDRLRRPRRRLHLRLRLRVVRRGWRRRVRRMRSR